MMKEQLTYGSGTVDLEYDVNGFLIKVEGDGCVYLASGNRYSHIWQTNGKTKRQIVEFNQPVFLEFCPSSNAMDFRVVAIGKEKKPLEKLFSFESINSIITFFPIKEDIIETMMLKLRS